MSYETKSSQQEQQQARVALEAKRVKLDEAESTVAAQAQQQQTRKALDVDRRHIDEGVTYGEERAESGMRDGGG
jgi:gamma-glutamylcysteine synthetase